MVAVEEPSNNHLSASGRPGAAGGLWFGEQAPSAIACHRMRLTARPWMLASAIWIMPAIFATLAATVQWRLNGWDPPTWRQILFAGGDWLVYGILTPVVFWACRRWPVRRPKVVPRAFLHLGFAILFCVCWALSGKVLEATLGYFLAPDDFARLFASDNRRQVYIDIVSWIFTTLPFGVIVYICIAGMGHAFDFFFESRDREVQLARMSEQLADARFAALEAQVNPHFLFNTLNTIVVRARDGDTTGTVRMVEQLSELLRRTLSRHRASEVALDDELDLVRQYVAIEEARFPDRLHVVFDVDPGVGRAAVPGFAIQHLVENAIRHGVARRTGAGRVTVSARRDAGRLVVSVRDEGPGLPAGFEAPAGRGLDQTRERLRVLHGDSASLAAANADGGGVVATLTVPYRDLAAEQGASRGPE
jgi:signal transduction histidine kinase